jgi:hypothetical protein
MSHILKKTASNNCEAFKFQNTKIIFGHHVLPMLSILYPLLNTLYSLYIQVTLQNCINQDTSYRK